MTIAGKGGSYLYDIHFWLGKDTSQYEAGTAAIKTIELDVVLGSRVVQYRELQGHESDKFLSYFKPCLMALVGGVASGFKKPEEEEFETRLYICRGKRVVRLNLATTTFAPGILAFKEGSSHNITLLSSSRNITLSFHNIRFPQFWLNVR